MATHTVVGSGTSLACNTGRIIVHGPVGIMIRYIRVARTNSVGYVAAYALEAFEGSHTNTSLYLNQRMCFHITTHCCNGIGIRTSRRDWVGSIKRWR